jgi:hypothetical protein
MYADNSKQSTVIDETRGQYIDPGDANDLPSACSAVPGLCRSTGVDEREDGDRYNADFYGAVRAGMTAAEAAEALDEMDRDYTPAEFLAAVAEHAPDARFRLHGCLSIHRDPGMPDKVQDEITCIVSYGLDHAAEPVRGATLREVADGLVAGQRKYREWAASRRRAETDRVTVAEAGMAAAY